MRKLNLDKFKFYVWERILRDLFHIYLSKLFYDYDASTVDENRFSNETYLSSVVATICEKIDDAKYSHKKVLKSMKEKKKK